MPASWTVIYDQNEPLPLPMESRALCIQDVKEYMESHLRVKKAVLRTKTMWHVEFTRDADDPEELHIRFNHGQVDD